MSVGAADARAVPSAAPAGTSYGRPPGGPGPRGGDRTTRPHAALEECHGRHLPTPHRGARELEWLRQLPAAEPARVLAHTCDRCRPTAYELVNVGGAFAVRRTTHKAGGVVVVDETARVHKALAEEWWQALLHGAAK